MSKKKFVDEMMTTKETAKPKLMICCLNVLLRPVSISEAAENGAANNS